MKISRNLHESRIHIRFQYKFTATLCLR